MLIFYLAYMLTPNGRSLLFIKEKGFSSKNDDEDICFQPSVFNNSEIKKVEPTENVEAI